MSFTPSTFLIMFASHRLLLHVLTTSHSFRNRFSRIYTGLSARMTCVTIASTRHRHNGDKSLIRPNKYHANDIDSQAAVVGLDRSKKAFCTSLTRKRNLGTCARSLVAGSGRANMTSFHAEKSVEGRTKDSGWWPEFVLCLWLVSGTEKEPVGTCL